MEDMTNAELYLKFKDFNRETEEEEREQ